MQSIEGDTMYRCDKSMKRSKMRALGRRNGDIFAEGWTGCNKDCSRCICGMQFNGDTWEHMSTKKGDMKSKVKPKHRISPQDTK